MHVIHSQCAHARVGESRQEDTLAIARANMPSGGQGLFLKGKQIAKQEDKVGQRREACSFSPAAL